MRARHLAALFILGAACSFVRDPERFSAGGGGSEPDASAGCKQNGQACGSPSECCTQRCVGGTCRCDELTEVCIEGSCCNGVACVEKNDGSGDKICGFVGACTNAADEAALGAIDVHTEMKNCDPTCAPLSGDAEAACYENCAVTAGLSSGCADCYAFWWGFCTKTVCSGACGSSPQACKDCCDSNSSCEYFFECSGFSSCP